MLPNCWLFCKIIYTAFYILIKLYFFKSLGFLKLFDFYTQGNNFSSDFMKLRGLGEESPWPSLFTRLLEIASMVTGAQGTTYYEEMKYLCPAEKKEPCAVPSLILSHESLTPGRKSDYLNF